MAFLAHPWESCLSKAKSHIYTYRGRGRAVSVEPVGRENIAARPNSYELHVFNILAHLCPPLDDLDSVGIVEDDHFDTVFGSHCGRDMRLSDARTCPPSV